MPPVLLGYFPGSTGSDIFQYLIPIFYRVVSRAAVGVSYLRMHYAVLQKCI